MVQAAPPPPAADGEGAARPVCCAFRNAPLPAAAPSTVGERSKRDPWFKTDDNTMPKRQLSTAVLLLLLYARRDQDGAAGRGNKSGVSYKRAAVGVFG